MKSFEEEFRNLYFIKPKVDLKVLLSLAHKRTKDKIN